MKTAKRVRVTGVVQGVGFRPFVHRIAHAHGLTGWVSNDVAGVEIFVEGTPANLAAFFVALSSELPPAARLAETIVTDAVLEGHEEFSIRTSTLSGRPTARISPDLPVCAACLHEMRDPEDRRHGYPYINCTDCGPRYSIILRLPYDRPATTMAHWELCPSCEREYHDPVDRRFHAQPTACPVCGPHIRFVEAHPEDRWTERAKDATAIDLAVELLRNGGILAIKGLGGYHLACDARNISAVATLRNRKFRKHKPFALMVQHTRVAGELINLSPETAELLESIERPIVLAPARVHLPGVAPENDELGVMLAYTPLHHLLFDAGAPSVLVMTSANRSSEPIAYSDLDALERLEGIADAFLIGERPIARRVDDSVTRVSCLGPVVLRRGRGYAPSSVGKLPVGRPILAVGADLKNTVSVVVDGQIFGSQHIGDLHHYRAFEALSETIRDLADMYGLAWSDVLIAHDAHPSYRSSLHAHELPAFRHLAVQHHRAHIASVLAERGAWDQRVVGVAFDGTGYGDDGAIWGGELFVGGLQEGFERVGHLRYASLPGGDAAARYPVQAAAGFLMHLDPTLDLRSEPFGFPERYEHALSLATKDIRTFPTTSVGRLFDTVAALLGFTGEVTFEGQAAIWLEHMGRRARPVEAYPMPFAAGELDFRPLLDAVLADRQRGRDPTEISRAFHAGLAAGVHRGLRDICESHELDVVALSGGVFQNELLVNNLRELLEPTSLRLWVSHTVPPTDGGVSVGQAGLAAFDRT